MDPDFKRTVKAELERVGHAYLQVGLSVLRNGLSRGTHEGFKCRDTSGRTYFKFPHSANIERGDELQTGQEKWVVEDVIGMMGYVDCEVVSRRTLEAAPKNNKDAFDVRKLRSSIDQLIGIVGSVIESSKPATRIGQVSQEYATCYRSIDQGVQALRQLGFSVEHGNQFRDIPSLHGHLKTNYRSWHERREAVRGMYGQLTDLLSGFEGKLDSTTGSRRSVDELKKVVRAYIKERSEISSDLGQLQVGQEIGEGANALVFSTTFAGSAALKILACPVTEPPETRYSRFVDEFKVLLRLGSTGRVVRVFHFDTAIIAGTKLPFIVMERCKQTLSAFLQGRPITSPQQFLDLAEGLLRAVEAVNGAGVVHRDLKPQNIFVRDDKSIIVGDFGVAWFDPSHYEKLAETKPADRLANFMFSAPEQFDSRTAPVPTMDIFAAGQVLYWSACGEVIRGTDHKPLATVNSSLARFDPIINQMVRMEPKDRYQSAEDALRALIQAASGSGHS